MEAKYCVVGGDGFIGSSLVKSLLNRGFSVHATILPTTGNGDMSYLRQIPGAHERLRLFNADLRVEGSFDSPILGCQGVFFVASPVDHASKDPETEVVGVAVQGTLNVLKSCLKSKTVKRVVFTTTSLAMAPLDEEGKLNNNPCSVQSLWSPVNYFRSNKEQFPIWSYIVSKTLAEQTAWRFAGENNLDLVTIGPAGVGGPFITPYIPGSIRVLLWFLPGNKDLLNRIIRTVLAAFGTFPIVHINDVCNANIFLMEHPAAEGRYLCSAYALSIKECWEFFIKRYPDLKIVDRSQDMDSMVVQNTHLKSEKLKDLGFTFTHGIEEIYDDCIESYKKLGLLTTQ